MREPDDADSHIISILDCDSYQNPIKRKTDKNIKISAFSLVDFSKFKKRLFHTFSLFDFFNFWVFRNSKKLFFTFRLFHFSEFKKRFFHFSTFRLFEIHFACFPPGALQRFFPTQRLQRPFEVVIDLGCGPCCLEEYI